MILDNYLKHKKPLKPKHKKIIVFAIVFFLIIVVSLVILFLPFKDGSTIENIINEFKNKEWNSKTITQLLIIFITWSLAAWKLALTIAATILYKKKKRHFENELAKQGLLDIYGGKSMKLNFKQHQDYVDNVLTGIIEAFIEINNPLSANSTFLIREVLEKPTTPRKEKIAKVKEILEKEGKNLDIPEVVKAIKQI